MLAYFHRFSVFVWTGKKDANTLRVGRIFYFTLFFFFGNGRKKISVFKKSGYCGRGQKPHSNHTAAKKEYIGADPGGGAIMGWGGGGVGRC